MALVIKINPANSLSLEVGIARLNRVHRNLPNLVKEGTRQWGTTLERDMKNSAARADIKAFTNTLFTSGIQWRQRPNGNIGLLFIRLYGVLLDSMKPHFVNLTRSRTRLLAWALQAKSANIRRKASEVSSKRLDKIGIYVKPHPFINNGWNIGRPKLRPILNKQVQLGLA